MVRERLAVWSESIDLLKTGGYEPVAQLGKGEEPCRELKGAHRAIARDGTVGVYTAGERFVAILVNHEIFAPRRNHGGKKVCPECWPVIQIEKDTAGWPKAAVD